jgi:hypothetical protein
MTWSEKTRAPGILFAYTIIWPLLAIFTSLAVTLTVAVTSTGSVRPGRVPARPPRGRLNSEQSARSATAGTLLGDLRFRWRLSRFAGGVSLPAASRSGSRAWPVPGPSLS